ncbi:PREDICTED: uncharacterized protein C17orf112 homolog [Propithecus coquereli]|uniref:uncharacterized protein C17orf112 homolog n=1 Tax=Propithecus coquereli TaxID=379532 RepID=UPI00063FD31B|nr:PREDICTED: uncharacterized protein C17orf112 homolog [Propithecus coquereli]
MQQSPHQSPILPSPPLAKPDHDSPVNQLGSVQNMSLMPSIIITGIFLSNSERQPSSFFRDEFALGKIFLEYRINFFWKFQTTWSVSLLQTLLISTWKAEFLLD